MTMKPAILTPSRGDCLFTYTSDLVELIRYELTVKNRSVPFGGSIGSILSNLRLGMVNGALTHGATHLLMIDSDMRFPPDTLDRLLSHDVDIVAANCVPRGGGGTTARRADYSQIPSKGKTGLERAHIVGFGVVLISAAVFRKLERPWFLMPYDADTRRHLTDDVYFCLRAREAGFTIWVDHDLSQKVGHSAGPSELWI